MTGPVEPYFLTPPASEAADSTNTR
jgi:hypothetical protein